MFSLKNKEKIALSCFLWLAIASLSQAAPNSNKKERTKLPSFVKICHRSDPQLNQCAKNSLNALKPRFEIGIPELYVPAIEPLVVPEIKMDQDSGAIFLHSTFRNINIKGLSNFTLNELRVEPNKMKFTIGLSFPKLTLDADYKINGKIMLMPLAGDGKFGANFTDVELNMVLTGQKIKKQDRWFIKMKDIQIKYGLANAKMHFENLFNGDAGLGERMNTFINENWEGLHEEIRPLMENAMAEVIRASTDKLFAKYSYDDLLPE